MIDSWGKICKHIVKAQNYSLMVKILWYNNPNKVIFSIIAYCTPPGRVWIYILWMQTEGRWAGDFCCWHGLVCVYGNCSCLLNWNIFLHVETKDTKHLGVQVLFFSQEFAVFIFSSLSQLKFFGPSWKCGIDNREVLLFHSWKHKV